ncbi:MAG: translation initiation factor IF-3 [Clostridia bacterium]|nr:translation initiation factor IF-3 [Clostridia bacterium]
MHIAAISHQINDQIHASEVRVIASDGSQLGIMPLADAMARAEEDGLDLVMIAPNAAPPVCRIMDYGKYRFEQAKREKLNRKSQKIVETKEIWLSPGIGDHDMDFKVKNALGFLADGDKVKVTVRFRGREMAHTDLGTALLREFAEKCADVAAVEKPAKLEGRRMSMFLGPKPTK